MEALEKFAQVGLLSFAVFRVAQLLATDRGPFDLMLKFRAYLSRLSLGKSPDGVVGTLLELFRCVFCIGLWIALIPAILLAESWIDFLVIWFASAGMQTYLELTGAKQG